MKWLPGIAALVLLVAPAYARDAAPLTVTSPAFSAGGNIPSEYTCDGRSTSPPLNWSAVPPDTKSIAVIVDDPDAPHGTFEHLVLFNLPPSERALGSEAGAPQKGMAARNSNGSTGFAPICPPSGRHHYRFQVLALDTMLSPGGASASDVANAIKGHVIARGELMGTYQRNGR